MSITRFNAIQKLFPNDNLSYDDKTNFCEVNSVEVIDYTEIDATVISLQTEYDANEYARNRQAEYPSLLELTVALYDTDDKSAVEAKRASVKLKYPKPE